MPMSFQVVADAHALSSLFNAGRAVAAMLVLTVLPALAQNEVMLAPGVVRYSSRGDVGAGSGELLQGFTVGHWRGLGGHGSGARITAFRAASLQDADRRTPEGFRWIVRTGSDGAGPVLGSVGEVFVSSRQQLGPALGGGSVAWNVTTSLLTPLDIPAASFLAVGVRVDANAGAGNNTDGLSVWIGAKLGSSDDNLAATTAPDHAWQIHGSPATLSQPSGKRTWCLGFETEAPVLQFGNFLPNEAPRFGSGGLFPDVGQGLAYRVHASGQDGSIALLFLAVSDFDVLALPIFGSRFWLRLHALLPGVYDARLVQAGRATGVVAPTLPSWLRGELTWQVVVVDPATLTVRLGNALKSTH